MKAMVVRQYGASDVFQLEDASRPQVEAWHVLVKNAATSVDTMIRQMGNDLPLSPELLAILGMDFAGTVE